MIAHFPWEHSQKNEGADGRLACLWDSLNVDRCRDIGKVTHKKCLLLLNLEGAHQIRVRTDNFAGGPLAPSTGLFAAR